MPADPPRPPMHPGQLDPTAADVADLVATQFPRWAGLPVRPVGSHGTVSALFRVGDDLVARLPLATGGADAGRAAAEQEVTTARRLRHERLPVPTPEPLAIGAPGTGFPVAWSVWRWLPGVTADALDVAENTRLARDLAGLVRAVRAIDPDGAVFSGDGRGGRLRDHDDIVATWIADAAGMIDTAAVTRRWERWRDTPHDPALDTWTHGDLMPGNLLLAGDRLSAVLDVGGAGVADPAVDLAPAWNLLDPSARAVFRAALDVDDDTWRRGQAWSLVTGIGALAYYRVTNPVMSAIAARTLAALLEEDV